MTSLLASMAGAAGALTAPALGQVTVGPNVNISRAAGNQAEGAIAINPTNPQNLFALYNNLAGGSGQFGAVSTNGGLTWAARAVGTGGDGLTASIGDPTVAFDNFGNLFLGHLTSPNVGTQIGLSTNGGLSFTTLATPWASGTDQPTITAGNGSVWLSVNQGGGNNTWRAAVTGLGLVGVGTTSGILPSSNSGTNGEFGDVAIGPGRVAIVYQNSGSGSGPDTLFMNVDPDNLGASPFGARLTVTTTNVGAFDFIPAQANRSVDAEAGLAYDSTGGAHNGRLYLIYTDETVNENNDMDIRFRFSDNNGTTWSPFVRLNDDATTRSQFLPKLSIDPATGHLAVIWYDARNSPSNNTAQIWGTFSLDNGATWAPNFQISTGTSNAAVGGGFDFGDYTGLTFYNNVFYPLWADNSNSTGDNPSGTASLDIYTAKVTILSGNPNGSCCAPDGTCSITTAGNCTGTWTANGTCSPNTCAQPTGACCQPGGACAIATAAACTGQGGVYRGNNTTCAWTASGSAQSFASTDVPVTIIDLGTVNSTLSVSGTGQHLAKVTVTLNISHTFDQDLIISLIHPSGTTVQLANGVGGSGDNFTNTTFDDNAGTPISSGTPPFSGTFQPSQPLSVMNGLVWDGLWTLRIQDTAAQDVGTLNSWSIALTPGTSPCTCYANCDGSTAAPILNVADFSCFLTKYSSGDPYANCDGSTTIPILNVNDFSCFLARYASGCP